MSLYPDERIRQRLLEHPQRQGPGFINPYNFVRLGVSAAQTPLRAAPATHEKFEGLSGEIVCELEVITPLCVADGSRTEEEDEYARRKPFFRLDGEPCLPASSLKGMVRSVAEALTDSCMPVLTEQLAVFRDNRRWVPEERGVGKMKQRSQGLRLEDPGRGRIIFERRGLFNQQARAYHDRNNPRARNEQVPDAVRELYERMIEAPGFTRQTGDREIRPDKSTLAWLQDYDNDRPWWFRTVDGRVIEIGRNFRYKWAYDPRQAIPEPYPPCRNPARLCPACQIFGMAAEEGRNGAVNAYAGRVRFTRGRWLGDREKEGEALEWVQDLKILGAPHISSRPFYLFPTRGGGLYLGRVEREEGEDPQAEEFLVGPGPALARGRKFYWHHTTRWDGEDLEYLRLKPARGQRARTNQNADVQVMRKGERFRFSVFFENLAEWEVGALLWSLGLPYGPRLAHHLGLGKPLGMGSCLVHVKQLRFVDRAARYRSLYDDGREVIVGSEGADGPSLDLHDNLETRRYLSACHEEIKNWFGEEELHQIPHVRELLLILSRQQPLPATSAQVPISYPPGIDARPKRGELHPTEKHFSWFTGKTTVEDPDTGQRVSRLGWDWSQRLLTIGEVATGGRQLLVPGEAEAGGR